MYRDSLFSVVLALLIGATSLAGQRMPIDPFGKNRPAATVLIRLFEEQQDERASVFAGYVCPRDDPWRDSLLTGLMRLDPTRERAGRFALDWAGALGKCNDIRLDSWYRSALAKAGGDEFLVLRLASGLLLHPTPENLSAVRSAALDTSLSDYFRTGLLARLIENAKMTPSERADLAADVYTRSGRLPDQYLADEFWALRQTTAFGVFRRRLLEALVARPDRPGALHLLGVLGGDATYRPGDGDRSWLLEFQSALATLRSRSAVPAAVRTAAESLAAGLQNRLEVR